jgi:hypothetical protein
MDQTMSTLITAGVPTLAVVAHLFVTRRHLRVSHPGRLAEHSTEYCLLFPDSRQLLESNFALG